MNKIHIFYNLFGHMVSETKNKKEVITYVQIKIH